MPVRVLVCSNKSNTIWFYVIIKSMLFLIQVSPRHSFPLKERVMKICNLLVNMFYAVKNIQFVQCVGDCCMHLQEIGGLITERKIPKKTEVQKFLL